MNVIFWNSASADWSVPTRYIGPYKISHWIDKFGYSSQVIDFATYLTAEELYKATKKFITSETKVLAISTTFLATNTEPWSDGTLSAFPEHVLKVAKYLKKEYPNIKFVLGGYSSEHLHAGGLFDATIMSYTDASEDIFLEYLDFLFDKGTEPEFKLITKYFNASGKPRKHYFTAKNKVYSIEVDDFKFTKQHAVLPGEALPLDISRGCIFACRFCNYPHLGKSKTDYIRGMEYVKEELIYNYENFGTTNYMILDDTFNETPVKMDAFYKMVESLPFKINYTAYLRADLIQRFPESAHILKESGLWGAFHGLESLHPHASNLVGKAWSGKHAKDFIPKLYHDMWKGEVPQLLSFIMGLPKETFDDMKGTVKWFKENNLYSLSIERLGLADPAKSHRHSISSEFERNSTKYGFEFVDDKNAHPIFSWKNETWDATGKDFHDAYIKIYKAIDEHKLRRITIWNLGNMQLLGYDKAYLLKTPKVDFDMTLFENRKNAAYRQYYNLLMSL